MTFPVARLSYGYPDTDTTNGGGRIYRRALNLRSVFVEGFPIAIVTDGISPHQNDTNAIIITGALTVYAYGSPIARTGSLCSCGHVVIGGSLQTFSS